jgi:plastocyanin/mono/diheme cytochrome c family protein
MGTGRNPGMLAVTAGVALTVLFALLGFTRVLDGRTAFGLAAICLVVAALLYIFYARTNNVEKTGYGALILIIATAFIIPLLTVGQQQAQATETGSNYNTTLQNGAALFGQYCASCHGFQGNGKSGPKLNNNPDVNKLSDDDLTRIISAGVPNTDNLSTFQMGSFSQTYGGPLTDDDISYLVALIRSSDPSYRSTKAPAGFTDVNGFNYVLQSLTNPTQIAQYEADKKGGSKPALNTFADLTGFATVHMVAQNGVATSSAPWGWQSTDGTTKSNNIIVKVGTTVIWSNISSAPHNVFSGPPNNPDGKFKSPGILATATDTYSFKFTTPGEYPFYCGIHPVMTGWITVTP